MEVQLPAGIDLMSIAGVAAVIVLIIIVIAVFRRTCSIVAGCLITLLVIGGVALLYYVRTQGSPF